jgi:hypothetical protein
MQLLQKHDEQYARNDEQYAGNDGWTEQPIQIGLSPFTL